MKLIWKFNLVLLASSCSGSAPATCRRRLLQKNAREEILQNARLLMETALATRAYTSRQVGPLLETQMKYTFLPQSVPSYSATEVFGGLRKKFPEYSYKEATLNPTNPRDRAVDWETDIVNLSARRPTEGDHRRARHADRPLALHRAPDPDQEPGLPRLPQHGRGGAEDAWWTATAPRTASAGS